MPNPTNQVTPKCLQQRLLLEVIKDNGEEVIKEVEAKEVVARGEDQRPTLRKPNLHLKSKRQLPTMTRKSAGSVQNLSNITPSPDVITVLVMSVH